MAVLIPWLLVTGAGASDALSLEAVLIGYFGPSDPSHPRAGDMWLAASMAVEQANEAGGYEGMPFRLVPGWSENPWTAGVTEVVRMAYVHRVWAIVGGIDGPSTHLAEQVAAKARLAMVSPVATDKTVNLAGVPWMFSCAPPDDVQAQTIARAIACRARSRPFVVVSATDHDSQLFTVELLKALEACRLAPAYHFQFDPRDQQLGRAMDQALCTDPNAVVLIASAAESGARCLRRLRESRGDAVVFGGPWMGCHAFLKQAGAAAEGVVFPNLTAKSTVSHPFEQRFAECYGRPPDYLAAYTYDATAMTIAAIRRGGLDRARIIAALREMSPWPGAGGEIRWDAFGANAKPVALGTIRDGRIQPLEQSAGPESR